MDRLAPRPPAVGDVPAPLRAAVERVATARGSARTFGKLLESDPVPLLTVDNDRRYLDVNVPGRLLFRLSLAEMRQRRIDDLTAPKNWEAMKAAWAELLRSGSVSGGYIVDFPDGSRLPIYYAAVANVLPGHHAIGFVPARWPGHELPAIDGRAPVAYGPLSPRQREVLQLVADGADVTRIATELSLSEATVRTHLRDALRRLGARNRAHAVALAIAAGHITLP